MKLVEKLSEDSKKRRRRIQERERQGVTIVPITKAAHTTYRSARPSLQKHWKNACSG